MQTKKQTATIASQEAAVQKSFRECVKLTNHIQRIKENLARREAEYKAAAKKRSTELAKLDELMKS